MPLIRKKPYKKLFFVFTAIGAISGHSNFTAGNFEVFGLDGILFYQAGKRVFKFDNFTAANAEQMVVLRGWFYLVMMVLLVKVKFLDQSQLPELLEGAINSR